MDRVVTTRTRPPLAPSLAPLRGLLPPRTWLWLDRPLAVAEATADALVLLAGVPAVLERPSQGVRRRG
jgi:hypothetical protein